MTATKPVVIITGVSSGIGLATAKLFLAKGWIVVGTVRGRGKAAALRGLRLDVQQAEMMRPRDLEQVVRTAMRTYGRLDALVCNAGYGLLGSIDQLTYEQMNEQLVVNTLAPAELARQAVPLMKRQGHGVIIGVSSIAGRIGLPKSSLYAASKFALEGLFESLALELFGSGVRVRLIEPSPVNTPFWDGLTTAFSSTNRLSAETVATTIWRATTSRSERLRYPLGSTRPVTWAHQILPESWYRRIMLKMQSH